MEAYTVLYAEAVVEENAQLRECLHILTGGNFAAEVTVVSLLRNLREHNKYPNRQQIFSESLERTLKENASVWQALADYDKVEERQTSEILLSPFVCADCQHESACERFPTSPCPDYQPN
jgi:predicted Zn-ribbon and HTH transcriptional regulator